MSNKPTVNFEKYTLDMPFTGQKAKVSNVSNHPNTELNGKDVITSRVVNIMSADEFETTNTIYKRI